MSYSLTLEPIISARRRTTSACRRPLGDTPKKPAETEEAAAVAAARAEDGPPREASLWAPSPPEYRISSFSLMY